VPVLFRAHRVYLDGLHSAGDIYFLLPNLLCAARERNGEQFFLSYSMAMLAFWILEISTLIFILFAFEYLASGHMFPLDMLHDKTPALWHVLAFTPFPSMLYVPISIYMGKVSGDGIARGLLTQLFWVVMMYALARFMWRRGIKKYAAFGG
jgi:ABC-2 type transport system permease protein